MEDRQLGAVHRPIDDQLDALRADVAAFLHGIVRMVGDASTALVTGDLMAADAVVRSQDGVAAESTALEERLHSLLARQQPVAGDLRAVLAMLRVVQMAIRTAALAREVVTRWRRIWPTEIDPEIRAHLRLVAAQATAELDLAVDAFARSDLALAHAMEDMDAVMDDLQRELLRDLLGRGRDTNDLLVPIQLAFIARCFERCADHAVVLADQVVFALTGTVSLDDGAVADLPPDDPR
jgi:phosphate transport system protein